MPAGERAGMMTHTTRAIHDTAAPKVASPRRRSPRHATTSPIIATTTATSSFQATASTAHQAKARHRCSEAASQAQSSGVTAITSGWKVAWVIHWVEKWSR